MIKPRSASGFLWVPYKSRVLRYASCASRRRPAASSSSAVGECPSLVAKPLVTWESPTDGATSKEGADIDGTMNGEVCHSSSVNGPPDKGEATTGGLVGAL